MATKRRDVGSGSVYRRESDGRWVATLELGWIGGKRKRKTLTGRTKTEVVAKLRKARGQLDTTGTVAPKSPTVAEWLHRWLDDVAAPHVTPATYRAHRSFIANHLVPAIGHIRLDRLSPDHVVEMQKTLRRKPKHRGEGHIEESAVLRAHATLSKALADAVRFGHVPRNVASIAGRPKIPKPEVEHLSLEQASLLLDRVGDDPYGSRWAFALLTGQRQGECIGLRRSHLELGDVYGTADISWQLQRLAYRHACNPSCGRRFAGDCPDRELQTSPGHEFHRLDGALCLVRPKQDKRKMVPIIPPLVAWLRRDLDRIPAGAHDLVWTRDDGRPLDPRQDYQAWIDLLDECGLPRVKLHSARHTCASLLLSLGESERVIMDLVGHSTLTAARRYQHVDREMTMRAAVRLGQALGLADPQQLAGARSELGDVVEIEA